MRHTCVRGEFRTVRHTFRGLFKRRRSLPMVLDFFHVLKVVHGRPLANLNSFRPDKDASLKL